MMTTYRNNLPQLKGHIFLTDGGIETTLIFHNGIDLPQFSAYVLLESEEGCEILRNYYRPYAEIAAQHGTGFVFETATWRSNHDWGVKIGYSAESLADANRAAVALVAELRDEYAGRIPKMVISGCIGPRDDGYNPSVMMETAEAIAYHSVQVNTFAETDADMVTAMTMTYPEEAIGVVEAAKSVKMPVVVAFTVETDGRLPNGQTLPAAIEQVDSTTDNYPAYYMINCAHPTHFADALEAGEPWTTRIQGLRTNASRMSHAELDEAEELDDGNPAELGAQHHDLLTHKLSRIAVLGGCCGTDHRHISAIADRCIFVTQ